MSEAVSKHDAERMEHEYSKTIDTLLSNLLSKIKQSGRKIDNQVSIRIGKENVYKAIDDKQVENKLTKENVKQIQIALENPQQLKGSVSIYVGNEKIFHAKDGQVLTDSLQLASKERVQEQKQPSQEINVSFDDNFRAAKGKSLIQYAQDMVARLVTQKEQDGSLRLESKKYIFTRKEDNLSVTAKDGRGEILNNDGFTKIATLEDMDSLQQIKDFMNELKMGEVVERVEVKNAPVQSEQEISL